jgi:tetratricopeptide (TPR) repeat protein
MQDINPSLFPVARTIDFHIYESCADLALSLQGSINEQITPEQVAAIRTTFVTDEPGACGAVLYKLVQDTALEGQFPIFVDRGGIISHNGSFSPLAQEMIDAAASGQDLRIFFVTTRRPVPRARANTKNMVFYDLRPMEAGAARQYVTFNARKRQLSLTAEQVDVIIEVARGDLPVLDLLLHNCKQYTPDLALADVNDAREVGRERATAFIHGAAISDNGARLLGVLNNYFNVPAEFIGALFDNFEDGLAASAELLDQHLVVEGAGIYSVSPPLVDAVARDERFRLGNNTAGEVARIFTRLFDEYRDENAIPVGLIDAGSIAAIEHGSAGNSWASQFILPSHYIYLARRCYDRREYERSIEFCEAAIGYRRGLTTNAYVYACRTLGMSAARRGKDDLVVRAVSLLNGTKERLARGYALYVLGFNDRLLGRFGDAQSRYEDALKTLKNDVSLLRELATVSLLQRETQKAIGYGERALNHAQASPYILDIVARARILAAGNDRQALQYDRDIKDILRRLENACVGKEISLFDLREAEYRLALDEKEVAMCAVEEAVRKTPDLAAPYLMRARIHLASGRTNKARSDRDKAKELTGTARGRHRYFDSEILRVELEISTKSRKWAEAVALFDQISQFQHRDQSEFQRRIVVGINSDRTSLPPHVRKFAADYHTRTGAAGAR